jgi:hypothetical protein
MTDIQKYVNILDKYNIALEHSNKFITQIGLGDLLVYKLLQNINRIGKVYINLFVILKYHNNPENALEFKIRLLKDIGLLFGIIYDKNIDNNKNIDLGYYYQFINNYQLTINKMDYIVIDKYIVFHTKCRFYKEFDYKNLKQKLYIFCKTFKSKNKIILLGEKTFPSTWEGDIAKITTIYQELKELNNNNDIIDMTRDTIYDNLNFDEYIKDRNIIHNAFYNILCGHGGQYVTCLCYSKRNFVFQDHNILNNSVVLDGRTNVYTNIDDFVNTLIVEENKLLIN